MEYSLRLLVGGEEKVLDFRLCDTKSRGSTGVFRLCDTKSRGSTGVKIWS